MAGRVEVPVSEAYNFVAGSELDLGEVVSEAVAPGVGAILTDSTVGPMYAAAVKQRLEQSGWRFVSVIEVPAGEDSKSLETYAGVVRRLARSGLGRDGMLFALGGGVIGDLGGFVAATYLRGISYVGLPTSLLAMVDSSVGGKVGLDLPEGKNLIGDFLRPRLVATDLTWLNTLSGREVSQGLAEVMKMGLLAGGEFLEDLKFLQRARRGNLDVLRNLILHSVRFKAAVVAEDEHEGGCRAILNYGHTIGHGLEAAASYGLPHGEAVAAGMLAAARLSRDEFGTDLTGLHEDLLAAASLPCKVPAAEVDKVLSAMSRDKKRRSADEPTQHRFVLLRAAGDPVWGIPVSESKVRENIEAVLD